MEGSDSPSAPQQLHCFWPRHSQFRQNKSTRALQLDLVSDKFHTLHLQFPIEIWSFDLNAYKRTNTFQPRNISHIDIVDDVCTRKYTKNNSITKTMTRKLCCYLDFIYSLNKSSYKCAGCKQNSPQEVHWSLTTLCCCSSSDSIVESVSELASLS